jgi:hypothetical protein
MPTMTIEVPGAISRRFEVLAATSGKTVQHVVREALDAFASSSKSRRAIAKELRSPENLARSGYSMADLGWLEGYKGQTVDELLLFESTEGVVQILIALEAAIRARVEAEGPLKMTGVERMLLATMAFHGEVNNGGYKQFFTNSSRRYAPAMPDDLFRIGCPEIADITQRALDALQLPKQNVAAIEAAMSEPNQERDRALNRCDIEFYERNELLDRLFAYVKANQNGIRS